MFEKVKLFLSRKKSVKNAHTVSDYEEAHPNAFSALPENFDRFSSSFDDFQFLDKNGVAVKKEDLEEYFRKMKIENTTIHTKRSLGDIVQLKVTNSIVEITEIDYEVNFHPPCVFDYAGKEILADGKRRESLIMFSQEDIEKVLKSANDQA